jgi:alpha-galactosidase
MEMSLRRTAGWFCGIGLVLLSLSFAPRGQNEAAELQADIAPPNGFWLEQVDLRNMTQGWGQPHAGRSVDNHPITLGGVVYPHGIGTHAVSALLVQLNGCATRFEAMVGVDDETMGRGSVDFQVYVDNKKLADSGVLRGKEPPKLLSVPLDGAKNMILLVTDAGDGIEFDHADWGGALLLLKPGTTFRPRSVPIGQDEPPRMVIPKPDPRPAIHGAPVVGATPGYPFLFLIPVTGEGPFQFSASPLPAGLHLDAEKGIISGRLEHAGQTVVHITVRGPRGVAHRDLTIVGGEHKLALTPPMGWNSWNVWAGAVDQEKVKEAADWMVRSGLAAHGYQYINIDDTWEGPRKPDGEITTNQKFPDLPVLAAYIHSLGLKIGIYSSPGPTTCGGYPGSYQHELQDAQTYAKWGIDYLKYDWCSYGNVATGEGLERLKKPYRVMREALDKVPRDIVYSLCQYGMGEVWKWGAEVGGNCWRTTGDINDSWGSLSGIINSQVGHEKYAGPGHWNDPDMLVVGRVGWGNPHPSHLTPNEQIMHITMWCMFSAPLLIGCDLSKLDPFTLALLTNDEALAINQDPLGRPASQVADTGLTEVWARPLADGTKAVALLNMGYWDTPITVTWNEIGLEGRQPVRDLWLHKNLGTYDGKITMKVPIHGAVLLKIGHPSRLAQLPPF